MIKAMIRLEKITEDNYQECINLKVAAEQLDFVSPNDISLAKAYAFYDSVVPLAIYKDDSMVGFIMLRFNKEYDNYFIWQFMIDVRYQSKGYGKQALRLVIEWMREDKRCNQIITTYIKGNVQAEKLYNTLGFHTINEANGEVDMVLNL